MCLKYIQFCLLLTRRRQPISSTGGCLLLLKGAPGVPLWPHLAGTDGDPSPHMDVQTTAYPGRYFCRLHPPCSFKKAFLHHLSLCQNLWNSEELAYVIAEVNWGLVGVFSPSAHDCRLFPRWKEKQGEFPRASPAVFSISLLLRCPASGQILERTTDGPKVWKTSRYLIISGFLEISVFSFLLMHVALWKLFLQKKWMTWDLNLLPFLVFAEAFSFPNEMTVLGLSCENMLSTMSS